MLVWRSCFCFGARPTHRQHHPPLSPTAKLIPQQMDMQSDDVIDVVIEQIGGARSCGTQV